MDVRVGLWRKLSAKELGLLNCGVGEDSWECHCKEIRPAHSKGDRSWVFFERNGVKAETAVLWPPHAKSWLIGKVSYAGRDWGQEEKGKTEDEMAGWHDRFDGRGFRWTLGVGDGQRGLVCCDSWGRKESDTTERLNWTELLFRVNIKRCTADCRNRGRTTEGAAPFRWWFDINSSFISENFSLLLSLQHDLVGEFVLHDTWTKIFLKISTKNQETRGIVFSTFVYPQTQPPTASEPTMLSALCLGLVTLLIMRE